jgi:hypothetical protein
VLQSAIGAPLAELEERYAEQEGVLAHLAAIREAILQHVDAFLSDEPRDSPEAVFSRFQINLLVDNADTEGAPVIYQDLPGHQHLVGRIEHHVHNGTLLTDFSLIRAGALHRANGGYLVLDVRGVLTQPGAWETLKRMLRAGEIRTESLEQAYGLISTVSLEPQPIPLDVKIVLLGERLLYYLLCEHDPSSWNCSRCRRTSRTSCRATRRPGPLRAHDRHPGPGGGAAPAGPQRGGGGDRAGQPPGRRPAQAHRPPSRPQRPAAGGRPLGRRGGAR